MATVQNENFHNQTEQEEAFDTTGLLLDYLTNWKWFLLSVVICLIGGYFYIATVIPKYRIDASIYLSGNSQDVSNAFNLSGGDNPLVAMKSFIDETELEVLKSRNNVIKIVDSLNLSYTYYEKGTLRDKPLYQNNAIVAEFDSAALVALKSPVYVTVSEAGDEKYNITVKTKYNEVKEEKKLAEVSLPQDIELSHGTLHLTRSAIVPDFEGTEKIVIRSPKATAKALSNALNIEFAKNSENIIRVSFITDVQARGVDFINALLAFYNRDIIEDKNRSAVQTEAFILDRLGMINDELKDVENRLKEYRQAHNITDIQAQSSLNLTLKSSYQNQIADVETEIALIEEIERIISKANTYQPLPSAVNDPTISQIIEKYNQRITQLNRALEGSTANNPLVASMQDEITRDKVRIMQNLNATKRNLNSKRQSLLELENQSAGQLASTPTVDKGLQEIFREQQVKVNIYTFLLQRREEIALQKTLATNTARLIDDPTGELPVSPKKMLILAAAFLLGLAIPAGIIFVRRQLFPIFSDQEELERITDVPVLGEICLNDKNTHDDIVVGTNVATPIAELFRLLRNNMAFTRNGRDNKVILLTSSISGEGKTFVATNLALTYALAGKRVCVVGMDVRRPALAKRFGLDNHRGVTTFLSGQENDVNKLITKSNLNPNLYILTAGPVPPNPNELLMSPNMDRLMEQLRDDFDYVIIDSAPIGVISDTFLILRHSDIQLFVTRAKYSSKSSLKNLHQAIKLGKFTSVYIVLNGVDIRSNSYHYRRYGEYGHYGKSPAYGYGYSENNKSEE